ncbi:hypothetical protein AVEN_124210-1 [Araneus ventricosus]|uniref:Uncharacterized protein n=1 Tax=Araneus ventricosus TaxID=182803 RepID=A0A4Y2N3M8_ARAVE|nr:hypothetical protein AVEN_124210-1 [Araneus ventricosus]
MWSEMQKEFATGDSLPIIRVKEKHLPNEMHHTDRHLRNEMHHTDRHLPNEMHHTDRHLPNEMHHSDRLEYKSTIVTQPSCMNNNVTSHM